MRRPKIRAWGATCMSSGTSLLATKFGVIACTLLLLGCSPARERPLRGAAPGLDYPTPTPALPPTLVPGSELRFVGLPVPSPGLSPGPSSTPYASPSPGAAPPIVRTIQPAANTQLAGGAPVPVSATLVGRGADLSTATLSVDGADVGARIERANARQWTISASQPFADGSHKVVVRVTDSMGGVGGFSWQFSTGAPSATPTPVEKDAESPAPEATATAPDAASSTPEARDSATPPTQRPARPAAVTPTPAASR